MLKNIWNSFKNTDGQGLLYAAVTTFNTGVTLHYLTDGDVKNAAIAGVFAISAGILTGFAFDDEPVVRHIPVAAPVFDMAPKPALYAEI